MSVLIPASLSGCAVSPDRGYPAVTVGGRVKKFSVTDYTSSNYRKSKTHTFIIKKS